MTSQGILNNCSLFADLNTENLRSLSASCTVKQIKRRSVLFLEGDHGANIYILGSGAVQLHKTAQDGSETVIKVVQPGEVFAEVILFEQETYPVTAIALLDSEVVLIPRKEVLRLLSIESFRNDFIASMLRRQRYLAQRLHELSTYDVEERFFSFIREHYGTERVLEMRLSKKDLAAAIGATPETLSRLIARLEASGQLSWQGKRIELME